MKHKKEVKRATREDWAQVIGMLPMLIILFFILSFWVFGDSYRFTKLYNKLDLGTPLEFLLTDKCEEKKEGRKVLFFGGNLLSNSEELKIRVFRKEYDSFVPGDVLVLYRTTDNQFMTEYTLENERVIKIGEYGFSLFLFVAAGLFLIALACLFIVIRFYLKRPIKTRP